MRAVGGGGYCKHMDSCEGLKMHLDSYLPSNSTGLLVTILLKNHMCTTGTAGLQPFVPVERVEGCCEGHGVTNSWTR